MKQERVTEAEILAALRAQGIVDVDEVEAVVLETDSTFSVVKSSASVSDSALANVVDHTSEESDEPKPEHRPQH